MSRIRISVECSDDMLVGLAEKMGVARATPEQLESYLRDYVYVACQLLTLKGRRSKRGSIRHGDKPKEQRVLEG